MSQIRHIRNLIGLTSGALAALVLLSACAITSSSKTGSFGGTGVDSRGGDTRLRTGDQLQVRIEAGTGTSGTPQTYDVSIDENGEIPLPLIGRIKAEGLTIGELTERIQANYVPRYYVHCNVIVLVTVRYFYVGGEVRSPSRYGWTDDITLLKAINTAGGFTDYANRGKVEVMRGKERQTFNCEDLRQHPEKDPPILPGDSVYVPRSIF
ncbi:MAG TPA: polysaccharide biosynthesis/export family protein [Verrucomicrobiae bacterium]|nr:polysaccharide biosynthesis/export family protein [Verrucomicrobiae bacterium]